MRHRGYRLTSYGHAANSLGGWMDEVTRGWLIYQLTDSVLQLGLIRGIQAIPLFFLAPVAGSVADRYSRKGQLIIAQGVNALIFAITALLVVTDLIRPWHLYVTAFLVASSQVFQQPSRGALISDMVPQALITNAIGIYAIIFNISRSLGPAIAGAVIVLAGTGTAFWLQALLLGAATVWTMAIPEPKAAKPAPGAPARVSFVTSIVEGWHFSWRNETVRAGLACTMLASLLIAPFTALLPVFARDLLHVGASGQGLLLTAMGGGALVSAALIASAGHRLPRGMVMLVSTMVYGLTLIAFAASQWFALSLALMALVGLCHVHSNGLIMTIIQTYTPKELRGRTMSIFMMNQVLVTLGAMLFGALADGLGPRLAVGTMGAIGFAAIAAMYVGMPWAKKIR